MRLYFLFFFILCMPIVMEAQSNAEDTVEYITLDTLSVSAQAGPARYRAAATRVWEILHTRIALSFDPIGKTATAKEWIKLHPYCYATDTLALDAKGMRIDSVLLVGRKSSVPLNYTYKDDELKIRFGKVYESNDTIEIHLKYLAMPYAAASGGSSAIAEDRGLYFINTDNRVPNKPAHIWTQGETESNSRWMITIDKPNTRFTTQVELTIPDSLTTLSNGALVKQVKQKNGMRTDIWKMDKPIQAYAVMLAIGKYTIVKDKWRNKEVNYYTEQEYTRYARQMFGNTTEMLEFFSVKTGVPYPWNKYSQVVVRDYVSGAMENTSASLFGEFMNQNSREIKDRGHEDIVSHELFHQWFGDYVGCESWSNLTVSESFANYGEQLWRRWKYGNASADELAWYDLQRYLNATRGSDPQLVRFYYDDREDMFDAISYNKGGAILHYLNYLIGDAAFEMAMKLYLTQNALRGTEAHHWRMAVEEATGQDWNWFFNQWYFHAGHPVLKVEYVYNDSLQRLTARVTQTQVDSAFAYRLPLKTAVIYGNDKTITDWDISKRSQIFTYPYRKGQRPVLIPDCAHVLPGEIKENKTPDEWWVQWQNSTDYVSKIQAIQAAGRKMSDSIMQLILDRALTDTIASVKQNAIEQVSSAKSDRYRKRWTATILQAAKTDNNNKVRAAAFEVLGEWKTGMAKDAMLPAVWDSSYAVAGNALEALAVLDKDTAYLIAKKMVATSPRGALDGAVWACIAAKAADEDAVLYKEKAPLLSGMQKFNYATKLNTYLKNVVADSSFAVIVDVYADMVIYETMKSYRSAVGIYMFQAVTEQKNKLNAATGDEDINNAGAAKARARLAILKKALERVVAAEQDAALKKKFEKLLKDNFE
ncbi:MAG: M1 family metallopeptidase [Taibaiella sp.]|nr:M1 family metallopeptidase [Taibaiella sp.]